MEDRASSPQFTRCKHLSEAGNYNGRRELTSYQWLPCVYKGQARCDKQAEDSRILSEVSITFFLKTVHEVQAFRSTEPRKYQRLCLQSCGIHILKKEENINQRNGT